MRTPLNNTPSSNHWIHVMACLYLPFVMCSSSSEYSNPFDLQVESEDYFTFREPIPSVSPDVDTHNTLDERFRNLGIERSINHPSNINTNMNTNKNRNNEQKTQEASAQANSQASTQAQAQAYSLLLSDHLNQPESPFLPLQRIQSPCSPYPPHSYSHTRTRTNSHSNSNPRTNLRLQLRESDLSKQDYSTHQNHPQSEESWGGEIPSPFLQGISSTPPIPSLHSHHSQSSRMIQNNGGLSPLHRSNSKKRPLLSQRVSSNTVRSPSAYYTTASVTPATTPSGNTIINGANNGASSNNGRPIICPKCSAAFSTVLHLKQHLDMHL